MKIAPLKSHDAKEYQDSTSVMQVLGCLSKDPQLLKTYKMNAEDFVDLFQQIIFAVIHTMATEEAKSIDPYSVDDYLKSNFPSKHKQFEKYNGITYLEQAIEYADMDNFVLNYNTVRKWSILRQLIVNGIDVKEFYDPDEIDAGIAEKKRDKFNEMTPETLLAFYVSKLTAIRNNFVYDRNLEMVKAGAGDIKNKILRWQAIPEFGLGYASQLLTTITYGISRRKFNIISAGSGVGKSRLTIANMCFAFAPKYWDEKTNKWMDNPHGGKDSALYIGTEMSLDEEVQPIILAYMANVDEDHIIHGGLTDEEKERVNQAIEYLNPNDPEGKEKYCGIYLVALDQYNIADIERVIEEHIALYGIRAVFLDYIHSTPALIAEFTSASGGKTSLREDQALLNLSVRLKEMTKKYNISIDSCTQLSGDYKNAKNYDESIIRGAKSIIDKCDCAMILSRISDNDTAKLEAIYRGADYMKNNGSRRPTHCLSVYKNRGGKFNKVRVWINFNQGTMRVHDLFVTDWDYGLLAVEKTRICVADDGENFMAFTSRDALEAWREKKISTAERDRIQTQEKADPSCVGKKNKAAELALKQAEANCHVADLTDVPIEEEFEDLDF